MSTFRSNKPRNPCGIRGLFDRNAKNRAPCEKGGRTATGRRPARLALEDLARGVGRGLGVLAYQGVDSVEHLADLGLGGADEGVLIG